MGIPNPLNAMQILWINIIMDGPPAQRWDVWFFCCCIDSCNYLGLVELVGGSHYAMISGYLEMNSSNMELLKYWLVLFVKNNSTTGSVESVFNTKCLFGYKNLRNTVIRI
jgi:hypothetical protein